MTDLVEAARAWRATDPPRGTNAFDGWRGVWAYRRAAPDLPAGVLTEILDALVEDGALERGRIANTPVWRSR